MCRILDKLVLVIKIILNFSLYSRATVTYVTRNTTYGQVLGKLVQTQTFTAEVFLGVPYAEPPINDLRFEYPIAPKKWTKQKVCTEHRPWCTQFLASPHKESEDCLYMNIIVPYKTKTKSLLYPVLVWIHGGSYHGDGANMFPIEGTINNIVSENIVAVFINYRVGPLGYLSLLNATLPGNYGFEDQLLALKWVKENIHNFDGNPDQVTLAGESAGAASASLMALSPKAADLFRYVMLRSGSGFAPWAVSMERTKSNSEYLIAKLGCNVNDLHDCLKNTSVDTIKKSWNAIFRDANLLFDVDLKRTRNLPLNHVILTVLTPVVDNYRSNDSILPDHPKNLLQNSTVKSLLAGTTTAECLTQLHSVCALWTFIGSFRHIIARQGQYEDELELEVSPKQSREFPYADENCTEVDWEALIPNSLFQNPDYIYQAVQLKYFHDIDHLNKTEKLKVFTKVMSDLMVVTPIEFEAELYSKNGLPVYLYQFDHKHPLLSSKLPECSGTKEYREDAQHGLDVALLFQSGSAMGYDIQVSNWTSNDLAITKLLSEQITNFVKSGNPNNLNNDTPLWLSYSNANPAALYIEAEIQRIVNIDRSKFDFWYETVPIIDRLKMCTW